MDVPNTKLSINIIDNTTDPPEMRAWVPHGAEGARLITRHTTQASRTVVDMWQRQEVRLRDIDVLKEMAHVLSEGLQRLDDLKALERHNNELERFTYTVSHDWCQSPWNCCPRGSRRPAPTFASTWNPFRS